MLKKIASLWLAVWLVGTLPVTAYAAPVGGVYDCNGQSEIPLAECEALVALYNSTNGDDWVNHDDWLASATPCSWRGIVCFDGHVNEINLFSNGLQGPLPPELGNLSRLNRLALAFNQLTGPIPPQIGQLTMLNYLYLQENQLSGPLPKELANLTQVVDLYLRDNALQGSLPLDMSNMTLLRALIVNNNPLRGPLPPSLTQLILNEFAFDGTGLCVPNRTAFQTWLAGISSVQSSGLTCRAFYVPLLIQKARL